MANYTDLEQVLNTKDGMTAIVDYVKHDDDVVPCDGAPWFTFNNIAASTIYASGNSFIGVGANAEHLKVCRRDGAMYYLYRQEGTFYGSIHFVKIRWEGYSYYSSVSTVYAIKYELFLFDDGRMFLNVIDHPEKSSYIGTSELLCGANTYPLTIGVDDPCPIYYTFTPTDETGAAWTVANEIIIIQPPFDMKYLVRVGETLYTVTDGALQKIAPTETTANVFQTYGVDSLPDGELLIPLENPSVLAWYDSEEIQPEMIATVKGTPTPQNVETLVDMSNNSIIGIRSITANYIGQIGVQYSTNERESWTAEQTIADFILTDPAALYANLSETKHLWIRFIIYAEAKLTDFQMIYIN